MVHLYGEILCSHESETLKEKGNVICNVMLKSRIQILMMCDETVLKKKRQRKSVKCAWLHNNFNVLYPLFPNFPQ